MQKWEYDRVELVWTQATADLEEHAQAEARWEKTLRTNPGSQIDERDAPREPEPRECLAEDGRWVATSIADLSASRGEQGWQLVSVVMASQGEPETHLYFQRPVESG